MRLKLIAALVLSATYAPLLMGASPQVVLIETNPWLMVIGSDSPTLVMYDDGTTIHRSSQDTVSGFVASRLSPDESKALLSRLAPTDLGHLKDSYTLTQWTDQPTNILHIWGQGKQVTIRAYGNLRKDKDVRAQAPPQLLAAFDALAAFSSPSQKPWVPELVEVMIWPYEHSPEAPAPWPSTWPPYSQAKASGDQGLMQVFLPGAQLPDLKAFIGSLKPRQAVLFGGKQWAISYRIPLPQEDKWSR